MNHQRTQTDSPVTDATLQALVAGELSEEQYRATLLALEAQPERWRDCALAFLVEQALQRDLQAIAIGNLDWHEVESAVPAVDRGAPLAAADASSVTLSALERQHQNLQWMQRLTMVAALLLISFSVGWFGAGLRGQPSSARGKSDTGSVNLASQQEPTHASPVSPATVDGDQLQYVGQQIIPFDRSPPPLLRKLQEERKIELEASSAFVPVYQGDSVILVPIQEYKVRPRAAF